MPHPLIVTLRMEEAAFARFQALRQAYFPPERNFIPAHITLFHALPGEEEPRIRADLAAWAAAQAPFALHTTGVWNLGRGVAFRLESPEALALRARMAEAWAAWLTPQDRGGFRPHITVQNKTTPEAAQTTLALLEQAFTPEIVPAEGLQLWRYLGGPWENLDIFRFAPIL